MERETGETFLKIKLLRNEEAFLFYSKCLQIAYTQENIAQILALTRAFQEQLFTGQNRQQVNISQVLADRENT